MNRDLLLGYACWTIAAILGTVVTTVVIASIVSWSG